MRNISLHVLLSMPLLVALSVSDPEMRLLGWYVGDALLVAALLVPWLKDAPSGRRLIIGLGIAIHLLSAWCGFFMDSGACDKDTGSPLVIGGALVAIGIVAEVVAQLEARKCRTRNPTT